MGEYVKKYVPTPGNVVINPCRPEKPANVGIGLINPPEEDALQRGVVENLWPGAQDLDLDFKKGDMVFFLTTSATDVPYMNTVLKVVPIDKLIAKE